jgi:hypothetical protein
LIESRLLTKGAAGFCIQKWRTMIENEYKNQLFSLFYCRLSANYYQGKDKNPSSDFKLKTSFFIFFF